MLRGKARICCERIESLFASFVHRAIRRDDFDESQQGMRRTEVDEDRVGQVLAGFNIQSDRSSKTDIAGDNFVAAFAHK